jgi:hypothetical protein
MNCPTGSFLWFLEYWPQNSECNIWNVVLQKNMDPVIFSHTLDIRKQLQARVKEPLDWHLDIWTIIACYCGCLCLYWVSVTFLWRQILVSVFSSCPAPYLSFEIFPLSCSFTWHSWHRICFYKPCDDVFPYPHTSQKYCIWSLSWTE